MKRAHFLASLLLAAPLFSERVARAESRDERIASAIKAADSATTLAAGETALLDLWREWDTGDPKPLEDALERLKSKPNTEAYASTLLAYAAKRRGDFATARTLFKNAGYVPEWSVIGPFDNEGKGGFSKVFGPETTGPSDIPIPGKERPVSWRGPIRAQFGVLDWGALVRPSDNICAFAVSYVHASEPVSVWIGAAGSVRVYWNRTEVYSNATYPGFDHERAGVRVLGTGWNELLVKSCGAENSPLFTVRIGKASGALRPGLEASASLDHAREVKTWKGPKPRVEGALATVERGATDPAGKERLARFIDRTRADDPALLRARSLATEVAEKSPTLARCLFAAEQAEDRNGRAQWVKKAESLAPKGKTPVELLLAQGSLVRSGPAPRDATRYFDAALAQEPDSIPAILARSDLYENAGLKETSLAFLKRALDANPRSLALLRSVADTQKSLGRDTEAAETTSHALDLRFDDPGALRDEIELSILAQNTSRANHFLARYLDAAGNAPSSLLAAAMFLERLGDKSRALALIQQGLELAPEDIDLMRERAHVFLLRGENTNAAQTLRQILALRPQAKDIRDQLAHMEPERPKPDEAYLVSREAFLKDRDVPVTNVQQRTLVDLQVSTVFENGLANRLHQIVFQPLTDAAAKDARTYGFTYEDSTELAQLRGARVFHKDGSVDEATDVSEGGTSNAAMNMYSSARAVYVQFPRVYPGDVVEVQYRVSDVTPRNDFADYFGEVVYLQSREPIRHAEYVLIAPKKRTIYFNEPKLPGVARTQTETGDARITRYVAEKVPALEVAASEPPLSESLAHVHVSTYRTWEDVGAWYWGLVRDQFASDPDVKKRAEAATKGLIDERAKVRAVYKYVVDQTRYVALEFGIHGYKPYRCAQIFARGFGDCKDKATLIVSMLKELGIPATIVIVRTQMKGGFEESPASLAPFDHAIAYVPSLDLFLDGTAERTGSTELPAMDRGAMALLVNEGKAKLVHLPDPPASASVERQTASITLGANGGATIAWGANVKGVNASSWRNRYDAASTQVTRVTEDLSSEFPGIHVDKVKTGNLTNIEEAATIDATGSVGSFGRTEGNALVVPTGPGEFLVRSFAPLAKRERELRLSAQFTREWVWEVVLKKGVFTDVPKSGIEKSSFGSVKVESELSADKKKLRVTTRFTLERTRIPTEEYSAFRTYCEVADRKLSGHARVEMP